MSNTMCKNRTPTPEILGFGAVAVDELLYVDAYPQADRKVRVRRRLRQCGGLTGTALVAAARLGARCAYVGVLGHDELSHYVIERLSEEGIDMTRHVRRDDAMPAYSTIVVDRQSHTRTIFSGVEGELGADTRRPDAELIRSARVLLVDHHGVEGTLRAVRIALENDVEVVADFERDPGGPFDELTALIDHLIISRRFARELTGDDDPAHAIKKLWTPHRKAVVITCGADGCWYLGTGSLGTGSLGTGSLGTGSDGQPRHCPAFPVEVVDTTGCGDVFHGAYAAGLVRKSALSECIEFASATAALAAMQHGGQAGCPTSDEVAMFLEEHGSNK